jgi:UPF0755 protein
MARRLLLLFALLALAGAAVGATSVVVLRRELERRTELEAPVALEILPGENLRKTAAKLRGAGLIGSERIFLAVAWWKKTDRRIRHGRHEFAGSVTLDSLLEELARPPKPLLRVTIPEGLTVRDIAALLEASGATSAEAYLAVACSEELRRLVEAPEQARCAEGYLFPDTYDLVPGMSPGTIVDLQVRRFREIAAPLLASAGSPNLPLPAGLPRAAALLILASIVEKETGRASERPRIAAVFYNRLKAGMLLQTDPTVIYGVIDSGLPWDGNLTRAHLTTPTPFNTYKVKGLPPAPICNPGRASIEAVLQPEETSDLYFVARGDGSHEFNPDLPAHNRAVRRFQLH